MKAVIRFFLLLAAGAVLVGGWARLNRTTAVADGAPDPPAPFTTYRTESPGSIHKITVADLPKPFATASSDNGPDRIARPADAWPKAPEGFKVDLYANGFRNPREIRTAPNGDLFLAESQAGEIKVLRGIDRDGKAQQVETFATGLHQPFGIGFYPPGANPQWVYIANTDSVVRFPYGNGDLKARGPSQHVVEGIPGGGRTHGGGHWTRDLAFSSDGTKMFVSVGSKSNVD
ncbi:MAG TPA: sorbosone dehydrogenase family protein, partial [Terriglobales bacterium]